MTVPAHRLSQRRSKSVDCQRPRRKKEGSSDHQYDAVAEGTGRRTIGQFAGHEIHLEIEDVLDKIKLN